MDRGVHHWSRETVSTWSGCTTSTTCSIAIGSDTFWPNCKTARCTILICWQQFRRTRKTRIGGRGSAVGWMAKCSAKSCAGWKTPSLIDRYEEPHVWPRSVCYRLTPAAEALLQAVMPLAEWGERYTDLIERAR